MIELPSSEIWTQGLLVLPQYSSAIYNRKRVSEYNQEIIAQSHFEEQPTAPLRKGTKHQQSNDNRDITKVKQPALSLSLVLSEMITKLETTVNTV